jgi:cytochrome b
MAWRQALTDFTPDALARQAPVQTGTTRIQLWDLPVRLFHWSLVAAVTTAIVTGKLGGAWMPVHGGAGLAIVGLVSFRLVWGFTGSTHARFAQFVPSPAGILAYARGQWQGVGHNPLGALSVLALLSLMAVQAGTGLFSNDDIAYTGYLASLVDEALSLKLTGWHRQLVNLLFIVMGLHVAAIVFYTKVKKDKLLKPMLTGWKDVPAGTPEPRRARPIALVFSLLVSLAATWGGSGLWIKAPAVVPVPAASTAAASSASPTTATPSW